MGILNRVGIKQEAKDFIGYNHRWLTMALTCLPIYLVAGAISGALSASQHHDGQGFWFSFDIVGWLLIPFMVAVSGYYLNHIRGLNPDTKSLYREGLDRYGKYFTVGLVTQLLIFLWTLLLVVPGIIKALEYMFVPHIIHDNPNLTQKQARDLSSRMTNGFKGDLFVMELSFILWGLFCGLTFGIGAIYVGPYILTTKAMYYENLKTNALETHRAAPEEFGIWPNIAYDAANGAQDVHMPADDAPMQDADSVFTAPEPESTFVPGDPAEEPEIKEDHPQDSI